MARYTGPKRKLERREQATLFGSTKWQKRPGAPGQHPMSRTRSSEYATQFREKQKVKRIYGVLEKQFRKILATALKATGNSGTRLLQLLELRLDNVVYRLGFAKTRMQARQFVTHGHVKVNGSKLNIPSHILSIGDVVEIDQDILDRNPMIVETASQQVVEWLDKSKNTGKLLSVPSRAQLDQDINERFIIEFYSR